MLNDSNNYLFKQIQVAVKFKAQVCICLVAGNAGLNPVEGMDVRLFCFFVPCVDSGLRDEPITR